jgi:hypothetical protein
MRAGRARWVLSAVVLVSGDQQICFDTKSDDIVLLKGA